MQAIRKYTPFFTSALLMYVLLFIIYPHYQYYIDPDGVSYLTISKRYAAGDFQKAVNGYWSPWSCWLTALLIKGGFEAIPASVIINTLGATGFLFISQSFFLRFNIIDQLQWLLNTTLALFLCYAIFGQSFDDLWECFFLLATLRLMLADNFAKKPALWVASGVIGALAYFAKAYSFPFFILNTLCCVYFICKDNKVQWLRISLTAITIMIICSMPWIIALHNKYGIWTISTAGPLNMSWYLVGHPHWKEGIDLLIPPAYPDSPYYWEDPYFANGDAPHFWNSWHLFGLQILRIGLNVWKFFVSMFQLSAFFPFIFLLYLLFLRLVLKYSRKVIEDFPHHAFILMVSFMLFPIGYLLINFEPRYIWYMMLLGMLFGASHIQNSNWEITRFVLAIIFPLTFLFYPLKSMKIMYDEGVNEHKIAEQLKQMNIHGTFTSMAKPGIELQRMERLAYFSGNQFYSLSRLSFTEKDILNDMRRYHVKYFFVYGSKSREFNDEHGNPFPSKYIGGDKGVEVIFVNP